MMLPTFKLEEFWKKYEFTTPHLLCPSDAQSWSLSELLDLAEGPSKRLWDTLHLGYTESPGLPLLREEIAQLYTTLSREDIVTFAGAEEGIYCAMRTLVRPKDHVVVITPCYQSLYTLAQAFGAEVTAISLRYENQWQFPLAEVIAAVRSHTRLIVLNYPHNPTGALLSRKDLEALVAHARACGATIFCDEVYRYLEIDVADRLPSIADVYERGISLNVMTKSFGLSGLRIGWLASRDKEFMEHVGGYKLYTSICNSAPSEILALIALRAKEHILGRNRALLLRNLALWDGVLARHPQALAWVRPKGGTIGLPKLLLPVTVEEFMQQLVQQVGVLIMPGSIVDVEGNFFRIGFGREEMPAILRLFEQFLEHYARTL